MSPSNEQANPLALRSIDEVEHQLQQLGNELGGARWTLSGETLAELDGFTLPTPCTTGTSREQDRFASIPLAIAESLCSRITFENVFEAYVLDRAMEFSDVTKKGYGWRARSLRLRLWADLLLLSAHHILLRVSTAFGRLIRAT